MPAMVELLRTVSELRRWRDAHAGAVAFVPTMGYLHEGHMALLHEARRRVPAGAGASVLSIFVNPTQFGPNEDFDRYPRDEEGDLAKAAACGVDVAFCPDDPRELYPSRNTWVSVDGLDRHLCGRSRPGHFRGVCTVVCKLLALVRPSVSIFGEKDYQQLAIVRRMHADLFLPGEIVGMPIVREPDGLARSSRNANLDEKARRDALAIPGFLAKVRQRFADGERTTRRLLDGATQAMQPGRIDYIELVDAAELTPVDEVTGPTLCATAVFFGGVRLIDNLVLVP